MNTKTFSPWEVIKHIKPEQWDSVPRALLNVNDRDIASARDMWLWVNDLAKPGVSPEKVKTAIQEVESDGRVMLAALALSRSPERFVQWFDFNGGIGCLTGWGHDWYKSVMSRARGMISENCPILA